MSNDPLWNELEDLRLAMRGISPKTETYQKLDQKYQALKKKIGSVAKKDRRTFRLKKRDIMLVKKK